MTADTLKVYEFNEGVKKQIHALSKLDNWHCFVALAEDYFFIAISVVATYYTNWYFYPLAGLIIASRQRALATLVHEASHGTLAKNKHLNLAIGSFFSGYLIWQSLTSYREAHIRYHHGKFGNPDLDPDYQFHIKLGFYNDNVNPRKFIWQNIISPIFLGKLPELLFLMLKQRLFGQGGNPREIIIMLSYLSAIAIGSMFLNFWHLIIMFWLIPYLTAFQILSWYIELSEHYPLMKNNVNLYMARNRHSHWLEGFFTSIHNENYHLVHHLTPSTPFWNVDKAYQIYLQDKNFAKEDCSTGGIIISSNKAPSVIESIVNHVRLNCVVRSEAEGIQEQKSRLKT